MSGQGEDSGNPGASGREPIFLLPGAVAGLAGLLVAIHLAATMVLNPEGQAELYFWLAFQPLRIVLAAQDPGVALPLVWSVFTHAFLHAGWDHLLLNTAWLVIFATPVARRYGAVPMLTLFLLSAAGGALLFAATTLYQNLYLIGASGGVAGLTGAAIRFMFQPVIVEQDPLTGRQLILGRRLARFRDVWANPPARYFTLIWLGLNAAVPLVPLLTGASVGIAWQAHLGGFAVGFLLVPLFERRS